MAVLSYRGREETVAPRGRRVTPYGHYPLKYLVTSADLVLVMNYALSCRDPRDRQAYEAYRENR